MTSPAESTQQHSRTARVLRDVAVVIALLVLVVVLWNKGQDLIHGAGVGPGSYFIVIALVFGDAVMPVLPGETTLNAATVLAQTGQLKLWLVVLSGAVGAVGGDSTVYWIARRSKGRLRQWLDRVSQSSASAKVVGLIRERGAVFLLFGRYIPGVRLALNAALGGVVRMPYRTFLFWSSLSGTLWSIVTCGAAYLVSSALQGYPVASLILTCVASTALISAGIWAQGRWQGRSTVKPPDDEVNSPSTDEPHAGDIGEAGASSEGQL